MASSASLRPTLPSLKEMLSDVDFDKMRIRSAEVSRDVATASQTATFTYKSHPDAGGDRGQRQPPETWSWAPPISRVPSMEHASLQSVPHRVPSRDAYNAGLHAVSSAQRPAAQSTHGPPPEHNYHGDLTDCCAVPSNPFAMSSCREPSALQEMAERNLPTYVLSADECPPDDDRRHGCGVCHRRFNRPSSLRIHMNSHTGEQPFECPFPGCSRRFSVNSNMRRHYRNHREAANSIVHSPSYPYPYHREQPPPHMLHRMNSSPTSSSTLSSFSDADGDEYYDSPAVSPNDRITYPPPQGRTRSASEAYPPTQGRQPSRPRACTISGCDCGEEAPGALRPAFQPGSSFPRYPPRSR